MTDDAAADPAAGEGEDGEVCEVKILTFFNVVTFSYIVSSLETPFIIIDPWQNLLQLAKTNFHSGFDVRPRGRNLQSEVYPEQMLKSPFWKYSEIFWK